MHKFPNVVTSISLSISNPLPYDIICGFMLGRTSLVPLRIAIDYNGGARVRDRRKPLLVWHCYFKYFISELMIWHNPNHLIQIEELR